MQAKWRDAHKGTRTNDRFGVNYPRLVSRAELDLTQAGRGAGERIGAREIFPRASARETGRESGQRSGMYKVLITYYPHYVRVVWLARILDEDTRSIPLGIPLYLTRDMNHQDQGSSCPSGSIDPREIY